MDHVLDKGVVVVDRKVLLSSLHVKLLALEARVVAVSVDTYLGYYAEAVGLVP